MADFTYIPGPGDYTLMLLDPYSSFATIDWERIGWEEAVRRASLFIASEDLLEALKALVDFAPSDGHRCLYCDARVYAVDSTDEHSPDCELIKAQAAITKAEGKEIKDV